MNYCAVPLYLIQGEIHSLVQHIYTVYYYSIGHLEDISVIIWLVIALQCLCSIQIFLFYLILTLMLNLPSSIHFLTEASQE